MKVTRIIHL